MNQRGVYVPWWYNNSQALGYTLAPQATAGGLMLMQAPVAPPPCRSS